MLTLAAAALAAACGSAGDRIGTEERTTAPSSEGPPAKPAPDDASSTTTAMAPAAATSVEPPLPAEPGEAADTGAGDDDGPFGRGPGPGLIAAAPPPGPLVDGSAADGNPAVVVKIDNIADAWPQVGINQADITFEILVEGVSRLAAVFHSEDAELVGPVRSARTSDVALLSMFERPCFAFSGGNETVLQTVDAAPLVDVSADVAGGAYRRASDRVMPHNLMTATATLRRACRAAGSAGTPAAVFSYGEAPDPRGRPVEGLDLQLGASASQFRWDPASGRWLRFVDDYAYADTEGVQVSPVNVVVLDTDYLPSPADHLSPEAQSLGGGGAWVLCDGMAVVASWQRSSATEPYRLSGTDGRPVALRPGRTWVVLAPAGSAQLVEP